MKSTRQRSRTEGAQRGRPTKFKPEYVDVAAVVAKNGGNDLDVARALGVSISTVWRWASLNEGFCRALVVPPGAPDDRAERALYQRAIGYSYDAEKIFQHEGEPVHVPYVEHVPPDTNAAMRFLTNRRPDKWSYRQTHELTGKDGKDLVPESQPRELSRIIVGLFGDKPALLEAIMSVLKQDQPAADVDADEVDDTSCEVDELASIGTGEETHLTHDRVAGRAVTNASDHPPQPASPRRVGVYNPQTRSIEWSDKPALEE